MRCSIMFLRLLFFFSCTCATTGVSTNMGMDVNSYDGLCVGILLLAQMMHATTL
jgi:hypothetical protein